ncbi:hypothetical protein GS506_04410 [Rhodococcus hoagii]|nr:hypothetical protein [Prescottella equi]
MGDDIGGHDGHHCGPWNHHPAVGVLIPLGFDSSGTISPSSGRSAPPGGPIGVRSFPGADACSLHAPLRSSSGSGYAAPKSLRGHPCCREPFLASRPRRRTGGWGVAPRSGHYGVFSAALHAYAALLYFAGAATLGVVRGEHVHKTLR